MRGSRYCETDKLSGLAWSLFGQTAPGRARVRRVCRDYARGRDAIANTFGTAILSDFKVVSEELVEAA